MIAMGFTLLLASIAMSAGTAGANDDWTSQASGTTPSEKAEVEWWKSFGDPLLERYIRVAAERNHDVQAALTLVREARAALRNSKAREVPEVTGSASYVLNRLSENGIGAGSAAARAGLTQIQDDFFQLGFDASWEIDVFGGIRGEVDASAARLGEAIENRRDVLLSVLAEVARTYAELRGLQKRLAVVESNLRIQGDTLELVENKVRTELARPIDASRARALLESTGSALPPLRAEIRALAYRLSVLTGRPPATLLQELLQQRPIPTPADMVPLGLPSEMLSRRPDLRRAERRVLAAGADVKARRADLYPRFSLSGSLGSESGTFGDLFSAPSRTFRLIPGLHLPIFNRGRLKARVRAAQAAGDRERILFERTLLRAVEEAESALARYGQRRDEKQRLERAVESSKRAVELARILYERGLSDYLPVLDAERSLNDIEDRLAVSETALTTELIALYKALGGGWEIFG